MSHSKWTYRSGIRLFELCCSVFLQVQGLVWPSHNLRQLTGARLSACAGRRTPDVDPPRRSVTSFSLTTKRSMRYHQSFSTQKLLMTFKTDSIVIAELWRIKWHRFLIIFTIDHFVLLLSFTWKALHVRSNTQFINFKQTIRFFIHFWPIGYGQKTVAPAEKSWIHYSWWQPKALVFTRYFKKLMLWAIFA